MKFEDIKCVLKASRIAMPFGVMIAVADDNTIYLLMIEDHHSTEHRMTQLKRDMAACIEPGRT